MLDHLSIQCDDAAASARFYDAVLVALGAKREMDFGAVIGYGIGRPAFWIAPRTDEVPNRQSHIAFAAPDRAAVRAFVAAAVAHGAEVLHEARVWPEYHPNYYGGFVRDPDGNNVEAVCHSPEAQQ
ncbi:MAG TPA: VOC family protein [Acidimicrobiia bacterium]